MMKEGKMTNSDKIKNEEDLGHELSEKEIEEAIEEGKKVALDEDLLDDNILEETNLDMLAEEVSDLKDKLIRSLADKENLRKRAEKERKEANVIMGASLDLLKRVFDSQSVPFQVARTVGMATLNSTPLVKERIAKYAMGL